MELRSYTIKLEHSYINRITIDTCNNLDMIICLDLNILNICKSDKNHIDIYRLGEIYDNKSMSKFSLYRSSSWNRDIVYKCRTMYLLQIHISYIDVIIFFMGSSE